MVRMLRVLLPLALALCALPFAAACGLEAAPARASSPTADARPAVRVDAAAVEVAYEDEEGGALEDVIEPAPLALADALAWQAPITGVVTSGFGWRALDDGFHDAVDIAAPLGADVVAPANMRVRTIAYQARAGRHLVADVMNDEGVVEWRLTFAHLSSVAVFEGDRVGKGERIGTIGLSGTATGAHLHFRVEAVQGDERTAVDPLTVFPSGTLRAQ